MDRMDRTSAGSGLKPVVPSGRPPTPDQEGILIAPEHEVPGSSIKACCAMQGVISPKEVSLRKSFLTPKTYMTMFMKNLLRTA